MGQYYMAYVNHQNSKIVFDPFCYCEGSKLMEHSYVNNYFVSKVLAVLRNTPSRVAWVGDYSDDICPKEIYDLCWKCEHSKINIRPDFDCGLLLNHTKKEYVDMLEYVESQDNTLMPHPLPLLTAIGNGRGGGDYRGENRDMVGTWFNDEIEYASLKPPEYKNITKKVIFK